MTRHKKVHRDKNVGYSTEKDLTAVVAKFKVGDRVQHQITNQCGTFIGVSDGFSRIECWVAMDSLTEEPPIAISCLPIDIELCNHSRSVASSQESEVCAVEALQKQDLPTNSQLPSSSNQKDTDVRFSNNTTPPRPVMTTSELLVLQLGNSTSSLAESPAKDLVQLEEEQDFLTSTLTSGLRCFGLLMKPDRLLWSLKMWAGLLIEVFEQSLEDSEWQAIRGTIRKSYQHRRLERPTAENESLLLPTPMAHSRASDEYRTPGQDKLEQKLRLLPTPTGWGNHGRVRKNSKQGRNLETELQELRLLPTPTATDTKGKRHSKTRQGGKDLETELQPLIPKGHVSTPELREWMMGLPLGWTATTEQGGGTRINHQEQFLPQPEASLIDTPESLPLEIAVLPSKQRSPGDELHTSQELSDLEEKDRHRLETKVERAFYEAGAALREIRDRRLYRSTHKTFEQYCKERFGMKQSRSYQLIDAAIVVENLQKVPQFVELLPTNESQCRPITKLKPDEQVEVWGKAIDLSEGKRPSGRTVKGIVERIKKRNFVPLTERADCQRGEIVMIKASGNSTLRPVDGYWGVIERISDFAYHICVSVKNEIIQCKGEEVERLDLTVHESELCRAVSSRIKKLKELPIGTLSRGSMALLDTLQSEFYFDEKDLLLLEKIEDIEFNSVP